MGREVIDVKRLRWMALLMVLFLAFSDVSLAREVSDPFPFVASSYLVKVNGRIVWAKDPHKRLPPASLTKIMTVLIALERLKPDEIVRVSKGAATEKGSRIGLREGEKLRAIDLICAALIHSANDACRALAEHIGGSEERFVRIMNERTRRLGLKNTHFVNSCGHDHPDHYSTAYDLAILTEVALRNPTFARIASTPNMVIRDLGGGRVFHLRNKNKLIGVYPGLRGVKTGFTDRAGKCLIAFAERDGKRVLLVLLNAPNRWDDAPFILDMAFEL